MPHSPVRSPASASAGAPATPCSCVGATARRSWRPQSEVRARFNSGAIGGKGGIRRAPARWRKPLHGSPWMSLKRFSVVFACACALSMTAAAPSMAVVGGHDAGDYPSVAFVSYGAFLCTGTLIAPDTVLTAGHCSSITGEVTGSPASWPAPLISVEIGGHTSGSGEKATVKKVTMEPKYLATNGYDVSLLTLSKPATKTPTKVAG